MEKKITRRNVIDLWAKQYPEIEIWLTHLQRKPASALFLYRFCKWANKTPPELIALKEKDATTNPPPNTVEKLLDKFCGEIGGLKNSEKYNIAIAVKSFFKWSYRDLAKASGVVSLDKVRPYNALTKEGLRKLYSCALNPRERALIPFVTCTGIAKETLTNLLWGHLEENWEQKDLPYLNIGSELLKGHGRGKYKGVRQVTFLTPEARRELLNYKQWIENKIGRTFGSEDRIWREVSKPYQPLSYDSFGQRILFLSKSAQVPFSWHDGRRWINTALEQIGISQNWARKIRGRKVKGEEAPYSQPAIEQLREKFREAVPLLEFTSEKPQVPKEVMDRIAKSEAEVKVLKQQYGLRRKSQISEPENCEDGKHCGSQQIVTEENLARFLSENWKVTAVLPSGKIVVQKA